MGRSAIAAYGLIVLAIGRAGEAWGSTNGDTTAIAISELLQLIAWGVLTTALWRPIWAGTTWLLAGLGGSVIWVWMRQPIRVSKVLTPARVGLLVGELILITLSLAFSFVWDWWRDGERHTGIVIEMSQPDDGSVAATIRDPATEVDRVVHVDQETSLQVGDSATVVVMRSDPSKVATPMTLGVYVALWATLPLAGLVWPIWWMRRCRQSWPQTWGMQAATTPGDASVPR